MYKLYETIRTMQDVKLVYSSETQRREPVKDKMNGK
jgi:hypothetical protein